MNIKIYYTAHTRSIRPRWLLDELEVSYELKKIDLASGEGNSPEYLKINPLGAVPAIEIDGEIMLESGAMCHWLADQYLDKGLAPLPDAPQRKQYEQWMFFVPGTLEPPGFFALLHSKILPEDQKVEESVSWLMQRYQSTLKVVNEKFGDNKYLLGEQFSAADIMLGSTLMWLPDILKKFPKLQSYVERLQQRTAFNRAIAD